MQVSLVLRIYLIYNKNMKDFLSIVKYINSKYIHLLFIYLFYSSYVASYQKYKYFIAYQLNSHNFHIFQSNLYSLLQHLYI